MAIALIVSSTFAGYWADVRNDQYQLIHLGRTVWAGGKLYQDCWENKPPGLAWLNALALAIGRGHEAAPWIAPAVAVSLALFVYVLVMRRLFGGVTAWCVLPLAAATLTQRVYDAPSINPDFYSAMFDLAAFSLFSLAVCEWSSAREGWLAISCGILWAVSFAIKQVGCVGLLVATLVAIGLTVIRKFGQHAEGRNAWTRPVLIAWTGFTLIVTTVTAILFLRGTLAEAWRASVTFNRAFVSSDGLVAAVLATHRWLAGLKPLQLPLWLAMIGLLACFRPIHAPRLKFSIALMLGICWFAQGVLALMGPSSAMRYWQATFPPMLLLAAAGIDVLHKTVQRLHRAYRPAFWVMLITCVWSLGWLMFDHYRQGLAAAHLDFIQEPNERTRLRAHGRQLQGIVPEHERTYVWNYDAGWYVHAQRLAACRYTYPRSARQMNEILGALEAARPFAVLIPAHGAPTFEVWCDAACQQRRDQALGAYRKHATIGDYDVWVRRP